MRIESGESEFITINIRFDFRVYFSFAHCVAIVLINFGIKEGPIVLPCFITLHAGVFKMLEASWSQLRQIESTYKQINYDSINE